MARGWLIPWGLASIAFGGASLLVPLYVVELGGDALDLGLLAAVAAFVGVPGAILFGRLADSTGRRRPYVLVMVLLLAVVLVMMPLLETIGLIILANGFVWFAFAAAMPVLTLLAVTDTPPHVWGQRIALLNKYQGVGWALGLFLGAIWLAISGLIFDPIEAMQSFFLGMGAIAGIGLLTGLRLFPPDDPEAPPPSATRLRRAIRTADRFTVRTVTFPLTVEQADFTSLDPRRFIERYTQSLALYFIAVILAFTGFAAFFAPLPAFLRELGFTSDAIFTLYLLSSLASAICFEAVGRVTARHDVALFQVIGLSIRGVAIPLVAVVGLVLGGSMLGFGVLGLVFLVIGVTWAVIAVTAGTLITQLTPIAIRGESFGAYAALTALAGGLGAIGGGWLGTQDFLLAFGVAGGLIVAGAFIVMVVRYRRPPDDVTSSTDGLD